MSRKIQKSNLKKEKTSSTKESAQHEKTRQYSSTKHSDQKDASVQKSQHSTKRRFSTAVVSKDASVRHEQTYSTRKTVQ